MRLIPPPRLPGLLRVRDWLPAMVLGAVTGVGLIAPATLAAQQTVLRASIDLVTVDLIVRDRSGALITGLTADDFEVREDGVLQAVAMFDAVGTGGSAAAPSAGAGSATATAIAPAPSPADTIGAMVLLFDLSAMRPDDVDRAVEAAARFVDRAAGAHVLLGVAAFGADLEWLAELTADRALVNGALDRLSAAPLFAADLPVAATLALDEALAVPVDGGETEVPPIDAVPAAGDDLAALSNDRRLRAIGTLLRALEGVGRKKALLYFSGGLARAGHDNDIELRAAVNAAVRANVAIYPVDTGGLQTILPGGDVTRPRPGDVGLFSGGDLARQVDDFARSQETLMTLAADTGGRAYLDTNDFGEAFARAAEDLSTYYLLGYQSTNPARDGRFRRIEVRVRRPGLRVETRAGYYADLDFAYASRADREAQLAAELAAPLSSTDLPLAVSAAWFRLSGVEYDVPLALAVPGWEIDAPDDTTVVPLDVIGELRDEDQRLVSRLRQTAPLSLGTTGSLGTSLLVYRTRLRLPPGRFVLKVVVRENLAGRIGSYETPLVVPDLARRPLEASAVVVHQGAALPGAARWPPHPTRVLQSDRPIRFYVEAYDPAADGLPVLRAGLSCAQDRRPVLETPLRPQSVFDRARRAVPIVVEIPARSLAAGVYTCQVNIVDDEARRFVFPRITFAVR